MGNIVKKEKTNESRNGFAVSFGVVNYVLMALGIVVLIVGYVLLSGGGSDDPSVFNEAMFDTRRLKVAPVTIVLGLVIEVLAIMLRTKKNNNDTTDEQ